MTNKTERSTAHWPVVTPTILLIAAVCLSGARALAETAVALGGGDSAPYMTKAVLKEITFGSTKEQVWVPTEEKIAFAWSDQPFAVHIQYQMDTEVRNHMAAIGAAPTPVVCSLEYEMTCHVRGFVGADKQWNFAPRLRQAGCCRLDGQSFYRGRQAEPYRLLGCVLWNLDRSPNAKPGVAHLGDYGVPGPGLVDVWFVLDPRWGDCARGLEQAGDRLTGKLVVQIDVLPRELLPLEKDAYGNPFPWATPSKIKERRRILDTEFEIAIRHNAWVPRTMKVELRGDWNHDLEDGDPELRVQDIGANMAGPTVTSSHRVARAASATSGWATADVAVVLEMPPRIYDHAETKGKLHMKELACTGQYGARYGIHRNDGVWPHAFCYVPGSQPLEVAGYFPAYPSGGKFYPWRKQEFDEGWDHKTRG
ncbi:hypothetical protein FJY63_14705, partial [Candidatus Sumerlaeota bacterium]|nr:hypothetical protein [Candidatus Sumerlaeota bacterium]